MRSARLIAPAILLVMSASLPAQQAGHVTLPPRGAAASGDLATSAREEDQALVKIEELRKTLADTARAYKKQKDAAKAEKRAALLQALLRVEADLKAARDIVSGS